MGSVKGLEDPRLKGQNKMVIFRNLMYQRSRGICAICGEPVYFMDMHLDHIIPLAQGGQDHYTNLQVTHSTCNLSKNARLPRGEEPGTDFRGIRKRRQKAIDQKLRNRREQYDRDLLEMVDSGRWTEEAFRALYGQYKKDCEEIERSMPR